MPIFQADLDNDRRDPVEPERPSLPLHNPATPRLRRLSEESLPTELCEGPVPDSPDRENSPSPRDDNPTQTPPSDRAGLIERLKRVQSPPWLSSRRVESYLQSSALADAPQPARSPSASSSNSLLPAAQITPEKERSPPDVLDSRLRDGLNIERPGSALHSGDFTHDDSLPERRLDSPRPKGPETSRLRRNDEWLATSPPRDFSAVYFDHPRSPLNSGTPKPASSLSSSVSSSFVYKPPTSPLVQSESNDEIEFSTSLEGLNRLFARRHTLNSDSSPFASPSVRSPLPPRVPLHRREGSLPYQAHQPRRSLSGTPNLGHLSSSPQSPAYMRSRRQSFGSDSSPLHHASMVGSYEESILRGRMSTTPSKPLDFTAQIGVLGMGNCKSSLRCPPHVSLPFPAVYYSYSTTAHGRQRAEDGPSPYVGQIDLENGLSNARDGSRSRRKAQSRYADRTAADADIDAIMVDQEHADNGTKRLSSRSSRRPASPRAPPGGSYRIPEKGQIQIIVKNQNKTAVKLFLVPYDLAGMEPGTKTFVRQRSYSAGPIIEGVPASSPLDGQDRPVLRYLVHLHICSPAKGRFFLYKSIRIVFANRVPDGKEKLRNETTWPEPRFTPYKPIRVMHPPLSHGTGPGATLAADKAYRRRSYGLTFAPSAHAFDMIDGAYPPAPVSLPRAASSDSAGGNVLPIEPIPFRLPSRGAESDNSDATATTYGRLRSPTSTASRPSTKDSNGGSNGFGAWASGPARYEKLNKGDLGYGGNAFASFALGSTGGAEGLLSQRLRSLGVDRATASQAQDEEQ